MFVSETGVIIQCTLTQREREILSLVNVGFSQKEIAQTVHITPETVKKHLQNCYKKLGARNKIEALRLAGFIS